MWSSSRSRLTGADAEENDENEMSVLKHRRSVDDAEDASEHQHLLPTQTDNLGLDVDKHPNDPTLSELQTLRRVSDKIPLAAFSIVIVELCERFAYYGLSGPFQNYLQNPLPEGGNGAGAPPTGSSQPAGAIGLGQSGASGLQMTMSVFSLITPIFTAYIADAYWGRYKTITIFCGVYFLGLLTITLTSLPSALAAGWGLTGWIVGMLIIAVGSGGIKANVSPLVADQYRQDRPFVKTLSSGERVIVDPNVTIGRIYSLFYWSVNVGSLSSALTTFAEFHVGFWLAFALPTSVFVLTPIILVASNRLYYKIPPRGSIVVEVIHVVRMAFAARRTSPPSKGNFWNRAKPSWYSTRLADLSVEERRRYEHITWDDAFVEEVRRTARACQIALFIPLYWVSYNQMSTNLVSMASTMTLNGVPNDLLPNANPVTLIIAIPIINTYVYPFFGFPRPILKITIGFFFASLAMVYSAFLQYRIYATSPCGPFASHCKEGPSPILAWQQLPPYVIIATSEIFLAITALEYGYNKAPKKMKSVVLAIFMLMGAVGSMMNAALAPLGQDPYLVINYSVLAIVTMIAGVAFHTCFRSRDDEEDTENAIGKGDR